MELLIPGLILVALMVYASTRIKKTAAAAFDAESVETDAFTIDKPEGFLNVINGRPELEFEAYSRDFGDEEGFENVRQARVEIVRHQGKTPEKAADGIASATKLSSRNTQVVNERKYVLLEADRVEKGIGYVDLYKIGAAGRDALELKITALERTSEDIAAKIQQLASSFQVK